MRGAMRSNVRLWGLSFVVCACLAGYGCRRSSPPDPTPRANNDSGSTGQGRTDPPPASNAQPATEVVQVVPGEGIGPFALGMTREAVLRLGAQPSRQDALSIEIEGITLFFQGEGPTAEVSQVRVPLAHCAAGVRVGNVMFTPASTYQEIVAGSQPCTPPQANRGATITSCLNGTFEIAQAGPPGILHLAVARGTAPTPAPSP
jgi:hypothetical protein